MKQYFSEKDLKALVEVLTILNGYNAYNKILSYDFHIKDGIDICISVDIIYNAENGEYIECHLWHYRPNHKDNLYDNVSDFVLNITNSLLEKLGGNNVKI